MSNAAMCLLDDRDNSTIARATGANRRPHRTGIEPTPSNSEDLLAKIEQRLAPPLRLPS